MNINKAFTSQELSEKQKETIENITSLYLYLANLINNNTFRSREKSLAITKLQEAKMWTVEAITKGEMK